MQEYELRVLEIDKDELITKLEKLGAKKIKDAKMKRYNFNLPEWEGFLRLRDEGNKITLTYKVRKYKDNLEDTNELELEVSDLDTMLTIFKEIGIEPDSQQEQKRIEYKLNNITFTIDTWPHIPTYLEVEAETMDKVLEGLSILGYKKEDTCHLAGYALFEKYGFKREDANDLRFKD